MSLAMYAAPFDNEINQIGNNDTTNHIGKKRIANNKTQKRYPASNPKESVNSEKIMSVLQTIHNLPDQHNELADFSPLPPPTSVGVQSTIAREGSNSSNNKNMSSSIMSNILPNMSSNLTSENNDLDQNGTYNLYSEDHNQNMAEDFYKRFIPNYENMYNTAPTNTPNYKHSNATTNANNNMNANTNFNTSNGDLLIEKLNYMIHLLEEHQDERTNNVTEEVVLYSFLGIFIIFIVDSFARVGKYTR
jgi:hypothetical protein